MADVAAFVLAAAVVGTFLLVDGIEGVVHGYVEAHVVKHEKLELRAEQGAVADAGMAKIGLGAARRRTRIARIGLAGHRFDHVAHQDERRLRRKRIHRRRRGIGQKLHVGFADVLPAGDRGAVEHDAVGEGVLVDHLGVHGEVLPFAARVGKAQVDKGGLVVLHHLENGLGVGHGFTLRV